MLDAPRGEPFPAPAATLPGHVILIRYCVVCVIAAGTNLLSQSLVVWLAPRAPIMLSILVGTAVAFFVKYALDKRWIFLDPRDDHLAEIRKVAIYGVFGGATTLLFWAIELCAWHFWGTIDAKYTGAVIGLTLGAFIKYKLDRHFVFVRR